MTATKSFRYVQQTQTRVLGATQAKDLAVLTNHMSVSENGSQYILPTPDFNPEFSVAEIFKVGDKPTPPRSKSATYGSARANKKQVDQNVTKLPIVRECQIRYTVSELLGVPCKRSSDFSKLEADPEKYLPKLIEHTRKHEVLAKYANLYCQWWASAFYTSGEDIFVSILRDMDATLVRKGVNIEKKTSRSHLGVRRSSMRLASAVVSSVQQPTVRHIRRVKKHLDSIGEFMRSSQGITSSLPSDVLPSSTACRASCPSKVFSPSVQSERKKWRKTDSDTSEDNLSNDGEYLISTSTWTSGENKRNQLRPRGVSLMSWKQSRANSLPLRS